ncbi:unnamed protein product [Trifolium pratense]|uniref:Uncharacterized protein n=1 Tax=Trifolium pratense TaxID=57577 RepID=A0ACB0IV59_TRIPR|nr:unnamed protein product [Trifolium pratense]
MILTSTLQIRKHGHSGDFKFILLLVGIFPLYAINLDVEAQLCEKASDGGFCDACGKDLLGVLYWCSKTNYALHPCCLHLPDTILSDEGEKMLKLCHQVPSDCVVCNKRHVARNQFEGWSIYMITLVQWHVFTCRVSRIPLIIIIRNLSRKEELVLS